MLSKSQRIRIVNTSTLLSMTLSETEVSRDELSVIRRQSSDSLITES